MRANSCKVGKSLGDPSSCTHPLHWLTSSSSSCHDFQYIPYHLTLTCLSLVCCDKSKRCKSFIDHGVLVVLKTKHQANNKTPTHYINEPRHVFTQPALSCSPWLLSQFSVSRVTSIAPCCFRQSPQLLQHKRRFIIIYG